MSPLTVAQLLAISRISPTNIIWDNGRRKNLSFKKSQGQFQRLSALVESRERGEHHSSRTGIMAHKDTGSTAGASKQHKRRREPLKGGKEEGHEEREEKRRQTTARSKELASSSWVKGGEELPGA